MDRELMDRRRFLKGAVAAGAALSLPGGAWASTSVADSSTISVGIVTELSGPLAPYGQTIDHSVRLAIAEVNAAGGVLGKKLVPTTVDTGTSAAKAADFAKQMILQNRVSLVVGPAASDENAAIEHVAQQHGALYFFTEGYEGGVCSPEYFAFSNVPNQQKPFVDFLQAKAGKRAFLFGADYVWPRNVFASLKEQIQRRHGQLVGELYLPTISDNFTQLVSQLRSAKPDWVYCLYPAVFNAALQAMANAKLIGKFVLANSFVSDSYLKSLGSNANGMYSMIAYSEAIPTSGARAFLHKYRHAYGASASPGANESVPSYNAIHLYKQAVEKAGSVDPQKVAHALIGQSFNGPTGKVTMTSSHACSQSLALVQAKGGKNHFVRMYNGLQPGSQGSCS